MSSRECWYHSSYIYYVGILFAWFSAPGAILFHRMSQVDILIISLNIYMCIYIYIYKSTSKEHMQSDDKLETSLDYRQRWKGISKSG